MGILDKIFGTNEEREYKSLLSRVYDPLVDKIEAVEEQEVKDFFTVVLETSEKTIRVTLFMSPTEVGFKKQITVEGIAFWLRKVSLALLSYSYYYYQNSIEKKSNQNLVDLSDKSYKAYWGKMFESYNLIFGEDIGQKEIDYYATGLKEDTEKGYTESGNMEKVWELSKGDYIRIAEELLDKVWGEHLSALSKKNLKTYKPGIGSDNLDPQTKKTLYLGGSIWRAYQQVVQPFLEKLMKDH